jgi:DNA-binding transcriptional LysR family regulator
MQRVIVASPTYLARCGTPGRPEDIPGHRIVRGPAAMHVSSSSTTSWACRGEFERGNLTQLLPDWTMAELPVHAYFPLGRATRMAARAFVDFVAAELGSEPAAS